MTSGDQSAYLEAARGMKQSGYTYQTDRNRMPLYPFLQSWHYQNGMEDARFFEQAKTFNVVLSVFILLGLFAIFIKLLPHHPAINLFLITTFLLFVFRAPFFQAELLFFFLAFVSYLLLCRLLLKPDVKWAILTGVVLGLTHLTKASILPAVGLYVGVALLQGITAVWQHHRLPAPPTFPLRQQLLAVSIVVILFLLTISPYIINSKRIFGHYFYNVNSTFYMWYDSWEEAKAGTRAHGDRVGWPDMPPEEIPSFGKYVREHTPQEIVARFYHGLRRTIKATRASFGYFNYFALYSVLTLLTVSIRYRHTVWLFQRYFFPFLFIVTYFSSYLLIYSWYFPVSHGIRFSQSQFVPYMFTLSYILFVLYKGELVTWWRGRPIRFTAVFNFFVTIMLIPDVYLVITDRIARIWGGL
jgi:hypothetical protein